MTRLITSLDSSGEFPTFNTVGLNNESYHQVPQFFMQLKINFLRIQKNDFELNRTLNF